MKKSAFRPWACALRLPFPLIAGNGKHCGISSLSIDTL